MLPTLDSFLFSGPPGHMGSLLATTPASEYGSWVLAGVLLTLVVSYAASKAGGELSKRLNLPPVLGELVGGVVVGISALHLIVFPEAGGTAEGSAIMSLLQAIG